MKKQDVIVEHDDNGLVKREQMVPLTLLSTKRGGVPIRSSFIQRPADQKGPDGARGSMLAKLVTDEPALDGYLLIHALASASDPYSVRHAASEWAQMSGLLLTNTLSSGQQRWSRVVSKLKSLQLISTQSENRATRYTLLDESGNGSPYVRPQNLAQHGGWVALPHRYWLDGFDRSLSMVAKVMLLISLDQADSFKLAADRVPLWYGISRSTAQRGFKELEEAGILASNTNTIYDRSAKNMFRTDKLYRTQGNWVKSARKAAMTRSRKRGKTSPSSAPSQPSTP